MKRKIAYFTDTHLDEKEVAEKGIDARQNLLAILDDAVKRNVSEIIFAGDIGETSSLKWFFETLYRYTSHLKITLGNHDTYIEVLPFYNNKPDPSTPELCYFEEDENFKYIYLDSSSYIITTLQSEWLIKEMDTVKPVVLFIHHPVLSVYTEMDDKYPLKEREKIEEILQSHNNRIYIFCGHYHTVDKTTKGNLTQFVTPATSFQVVKQKGKVEYDTVAFGYRIIDINEDRIDTEVVWLR